MTSAHCPDSQPQLLPFHRAHPGEPTHQLTWPMALRALMLLSEAAHPADPALTRLSDEDLAQLRATLVLLNGGEPTSAA